MFIFIHLFNYLGVSENNFYETMSSANFFKISSIVESCSEILEEEIDSSNCISIWRFAKSEQYENLSIRAFEYIRENYEEVFPFQYIIFEILFH